MGSDQPNKKTPPPNKDLKRRNTANQNLQKSMDDFLIKSIMDDLSGINIRTNKDNDDWIDLSNEIGGINGGNNASNNKVEEININNNGTNNVPMASTSNNFYPNKNKKEDKKVSKIKEIRKHFENNNDNDNNDEINNEQNQENNNNENIINNNNVNNNINQNININNELNQQSNNNQNNSNNNNIINNQIQNNNSPNNQKTFIDYAKLFSNNKIPRKVFLFDNPNIFDSFLIILNNINYISKYIERKEEIIKKNIKKYEEAEHYYLTGILYYINKYLWTARAEDIKPKNDLRLLYLKFLDCYVQINCKDQNPELCLYEPENIISIIFFIFHKINEEFTSEIDKSKINKFNSGNIQLNNFMNNYMMNNYSVISDVFAIFYVKESPIHNCGTQMMLYNNINNLQKEYSDSNYIELDLKNNEPPANIYSSNIFNINGYFNNNNNSQINASNDIYSQINKDFYRTENFYCQLCGLNTQKYIKKQFYSLPKVLTIILKNNDGSFKLDDEINLNKYTHFSGNFNYYLIAIMCKYNYNNNYITYCFNHRDGNWYYYTANQNSISKVVSLDLNAIPLVLVYQNTDKIEFKYNKINLDKYNNKKGYLFRFSNQLPQRTLYFEEEATIKDAKIEIGKYFNLKNLKIMINGNIGKDEDKLSDIADNTENKSPIVHGDQK